MQLSEAEKRNILESQLSEGTRNIDEPISENELLVILNKKNQGRPFNDDLFEQLSHQVHKNRSTLTIRNFVEIWMQAENRLLTNIERLKSETQELNEERDNCVVSKQESENEKLNAHGIMPNSELMIFIRSIEDICRVNGQKVRANFVLTCEGQSAETGLSDDPLLFEINKNFKFSIKTGAEPLDIRMFPVNTSDPEGEGAIRIPLHALNSQNRISESYNFKDHYDRVLPTVIHLEMQWIYSNQKLYTDAIHSLDEMIRAKQEEQENAENYLEELYAPFPPLKKTLKPKEKPVAVLGVYNPNVAFATEKQFAKMPEATNRIFSRLLLYSIYVYVFMALISSYDRTLFLDLLISLLLFSAILLNTPQLIKPFAVKVFAGIILAILIDIVWLIFYMNIWWNTGYNDSYSLLYVRRVMVVCSFILMVVRLLVLFALGVSYSELAVGEDEFLLEEGMKRNDAQVYKPYGGASAYPDF
jgi:hypothetical protein